MKRVAFASLLALLFSALVLQNHSTAQTDGPSVRGSFQISTDGGPTMYIEFHAKLEKDGSTIGETILQDRSSSDKKADGDDRSSTSSSPGFFAKAQFDCLFVKENRAVMSGSVSESSSSQYIGRRLLLVVQDGDGFNPPGKDRLTFGIYRQTAKSWIPTDSERPDEQSGAASWVAQDSERPDDEPVLPTKSETIGCHSFPISSFSFIDAKQGHGDIKIRP
jgi:hypothetical protein